MTAGGDARARFGLAATTRCRHSTGVRVFLLGALAAGCSSAPPAPGPRIANAYVAPADAPPAPIVRVTTVGHSPDPAFDVGDAIPAMPPAVCADPVLKSADFDLDGDGRTDMHKAYAPGPAGDYVLCKVTDFDHDGRMDMAALYDPAGAVLVEYFDFDFNGTTEAITRHDQAAGTEITSRDTDGDGLIDTITAGPAVRP